MIPAGAATLTWSMYYNNHAGTFDSTSQYIAVNLRDPITDEVVFTAWKTAPDDPSVLSGMTTFAADIGAFAGVVMRIDVEMQVQTYYCDAAFDDFVIRSSP